MHNNDLKKTIANHKLVSSLVVTGVLALSQAACSGAIASVPQPSSSNASPTATAAPKAAEAMPAAPAKDVAQTQIVTVSMTNFSFIFTPAQISAGTVKFVVKNDATDAVHEFFLVKTDLPVGKLPLESDGTSIDEQSTQFTKLGSVEDIDPGKSGEMTVKLTPGHYVYFCNTTGHYKLGMAGEVTIPATGSASLMSNSMSSGMGTTATAPTGDVEVVTVSMTDFAFKFTPSTIKAGTVKFVVKNDATEQMHEMFLVKTDLAVNKLPLASDGSSIDEDSTQFTKLGSVEDLDAGKSGEMTVKLEPGRYVYFCNKQGHYKMGMAGELTVVQ